MKTIVVAIDFSKWSIYALKYAILIANRTEANIEMVWVDKQTSSIPVQLSLKKDYQNEIRNNFESLINKYQKKLKKGTISYKIRKGKVYTEVVNQAKYSDAFLIVAGTHGASGFEQFWIGSNAYRIVASATCPVITIRNGYCKLETASKILMPIDDTLETRQKVPFTSYIAKVFDAEIEVLKIYPDSLKDIKNIVDKYAEQAIKYLDKYEVKYKVSSLELDGKMSNAVIDYAEKNQVDLISIMTEQEFLSSNLILGNHAQQVVNHSPIPVLCYHTVDIFEVSSR